MNVLAAALQAETIIEDTFTGYPDNALISADPAGPANGLSGNWTFVPNSDFFKGATDHNLTLRAKTKTQVVRL